MDRVLGEITGLYAPDQGMDARLGDESRVGRRYVKTENDPKGGAIYLMSTVGGPFVKLGWVKHPERVERRRDAIQVGCPYQLQVVVTVEVDTRRAETLLHKTFEAQHFRGEWFRCEGAIKRFILVAAAYPELKLEALLEKVLDEMSLD